MAYTVIDKLFSMRMSLDRRQGYVNVPESEKGDLEDITNEDCVAKEALSPRRYRVWQRCPNLTQLFILAGSLSLIIITTPYIDLRFKLRVPDRLDCGLSIQEANAKGCIFDTLSKAWLPSSCPFYGLDEYMAAGLAISNDTDKPWPFYREKTQEISIQEMSHMAAARKADIQEFQTSTREHVTHCAWMLIRMAHAYKFSERRDLNVDSFEHNKHCALYLLNRSLEAPGSDDIAVRGNVIFGGC